MVNRTLLVLPACLGAVALALAAIVLSMSDRAAAADVVAVDGGGTHTCAVDGSGGLHCWGANGSGQLGDGAGGESGDMSTEPVAVGNLSTGVEAVTAGGRHTCAVSSAGGVLCWGENTLGQLGSTPPSTCEAPFVDPFPCALTPISVPGAGSDVVAVSAGNAHTCAIDGSTGVTCWGSNFRGQLGVETAETCGSLATPCSTTPVAVPGLDSGVAAIAAGADHTCALMADGSVKCWGLHSSGQLGADATETCGPSACSLTPLDVCADAACTTLLADVDAIDVGASHSCALAGGEVWCWGGNGTAQLGQGQGDLENRERPVSVCATEACTAPLSNVTAIAAGGLVGSSSHTCAITGDALLLCWGGNFFGELGDGQSCPGTCGVPSQTFGLVDVLSVTAGDVHSCATAVAGLTCWGGNDDGRVGDGTTIQRVGPVAVSGLGEKGEPTSTATSVPPTPTPTATEPPIEAGDADCSGSVNSIDAAVVLQFGAGLIASLACESAADVSNDGTINSIDSAIILQFVAGLLSSLS